MQGRINVIYNQLSKSEKKIADYFIHNEETIINSTIQDVAKNIGTSPSSVSRFVNKVFGKPYNEFKIELAKIIEKNNFQDASSIIEWASEFEKMPAKIIYNIEKVCKDVISYNSISMFKKIIDQMHKAETIYIFGVGNSGIVAQDLCQKLLKLKKRTIYLIDSNYGLFNSVMIKPNDLVFAISVSGLTKEILITTKKAKGKGAKVVAITSNSIGELAKLADYPIIIPNIENSSFRLGAIFSRYAMLFVVDMLFIGLSKKTTDNIDEYLSEYYNLVEEYKK